MVVTEWDNPEIIDDVADDDHDGDDDGDDGDDDDEYYYYGCLTAGRSWMDGGGWVGRRGKKKGRRQQAGKEWARNRAMEKAGNGKHFHTRQ